MSARRSWFLRLARAYVRRKLRRGLDGVHVAGLEATRRLAERGPLIVAANHVAWWDPLLLVALDEALGTESHAVMDAANLRRLPFFGWIGAVPLDRQDPRQALRDLRAAAALADGPRRAVWIFPQGRQRPSHLRPLGFHPGVARLARGSGAPVVPLSLAYAFAEAPRPRAYACFGAPVDGAGLAPRALTAQLEERVAHGLRRVDEAHERGAAGFAPLFDAGAPGRVPLGGRVLAALGGGGETHD